MSDLIRRPNGRFVKRKQLRNEIKCVAMMNEAKKNRVKELRELQKNTQNTYKCEGQRITNYSVLGKNLKCVKCKDVLSLENIQLEKRIETHSILSIDCQKCKIISFIHSGKVQSTASGESYAESNLTLVFGAMHSGIDYTGANKLLACMNIPSISVETYKKYEGIVGSCIEEVAKDSCKKAAEEEKRLVLEKVEQICQQL